jgi:hypothetical protein
MTNTGTRAIAGALALSLMGVPAGAHHSGQMFESERTVTLEGVVKEFQYTNPHSWLLVEVTSADGTVTTWGFEAEGPSTLQRAGIRPSDLPAGTRITITGRPMRDGQPAAAWEHAELEGGRRLEPRRGFQVR